jgi:hypothetical protein
MSAFQKPTTSKAALKMGIYGPAGSGKTFTALLFAEGLARHAGKRVAFIDTEHGTAFYGQAVPQRAVHPEAFDFDVLYTRSITEVLDALHALDPAEHGVVVVDSISHLWDSCKAAYAGRTTRAGTVPMHAWTAIKRPYKELMHRLLTSPVHVLICGRQGVDYAEDEASGELKNLGFRMRAEGETAYEPDVLLRLEARKEGKAKTATPTAHVEKDRSGVLAGKTILLPDFAKVAEPLLGLLGDTQAAVPTEDEVGLKDAEALARREDERLSRSGEVASIFAARIAGAATAAELKKVGADLTPAVKVTMVERDLAKVRSLYGERLQRLKPTDAAALVAAKG